MAHKFSLEVMKTIKSNNPYDWMTFIREYCNKYGYAVRWNCPLSCSFYSQLKAIMPERFLNSRQIYQALRQHCGSAQYLKSTLKPRPRYNIRGKQDGFVRRQDSDFAWEKLCKLHPKLARELAPKIRRAVIEVFPEVKPAGPNRPILTLRKQKIKTIDDV